MKHARADYDRIQDPSGLIPADEPVFLLRGQDKHAAATVLDYASRVALDPEADQEIARLSVGQAAAMREWPTKKSPDHPAVAAFPNAFRDVLAERMRHFAKGFDAAHDDAHAAGEIGRAAVAFAMFGAATLELEASGMGDIAEAKAGLAEVVAETYPWPEGANYEDVRSSYVKAAALLIAEIERFDRAEALRLARST